MNRVIKPGMKFLIPFEVTCVGDTTVSGRTPDTFSDLPIVRERFFSLTPEGGWPREPFKHGDRVINKNGSGGGGTVWGPEVDGKIAVDFGVSNTIYMREARHYQLVDS